MRELFEKIGEEISDHASAHRLPAGLVLTGGGSLLAGPAELGRDVLRMPVRVASPQGVGGLTDHLLTPVYSTSIGLLLWAARVDPRAGARALRTAAQRHPGWGRDARPRAPLLPLTRGPPGRDVDRMRQKNVPSTLRQDDSRA